MPIYPNSALCSCTADLHVAPRVSKNRTEDRAFTSPLDPAPSLGSGKRQTVSIFKIRPFFFYITLLEVNQVSVKHPLIFLSCLFAILLYILSPLALSWLHIWVLNTVLCWHYIDRQLRIVWSPAESICCQMEAVSKVYGTTGLAVSLVLLLVHQPQKLIVKTMDYCIFFCLSLMFFHVSSNHGGLWNGGKPDSSPCSGSTFQQISIRTTNTTTHCCVFRELHGSMLEKYLLKQTQPQNDTPSWLFGPSEGVFLLKGSSSCTPGRTVVF